MRLTLLTVIFALGSLCGYAQVGNTGNLDRDFGFNGIRFRENIQKYTADVTPENGEPGRFLVTGSKYLSFEGLPVSELLLETREGRIVRIRLRTAKENGPLFLQALIRKYGTPFMYLTDQEYGAFEEHMQVIDADYFWGGKRVALLYMHRVGDDSENVYIQFSPADEFMRPSDDLQ